MRADGVRNPADLQPCGQMGVGNLVDLQPCGQIGGSTIQQTSGGWGANPARARRSLAQRAGGPPALGCLLKNHFEWALYA